MDTYADIKQALLDTITSLNILFDKTATVPGSTNRLFSDWKKSCGRIHKQLTEEVIRVAVVGPIKSGKSTFVNAVAGGDYLKRGAGVVTSFVTKIRKGKKLQANLFLKSWDEVNADINQSLNLIPNLYSHDQEDSFDIRRSHDRERLQTAVSNMEPHQLVTNGAVDADSLLLISYLKGYEHVRKLLSSDATALVYKGKTFGKHREFVASDPLSVYLKDIRVEIFTDSLTDYVEVADCQGSDSPNPRHLAMIQDYLNLTHLIVYVISSRTGIRQADIRFLSIIKEMGIMENILFVINCDFNEHESREDLDRLVLKAKEDLAYLKPDADVFAFSSLLNLFRVEKSRLIEKDQRRYEQWESDTELVTFSDTQYAAFRQFLSDRLQRERYALLLQNHMERLRLITGGVRNWSRVNQEVLTRDKDQIEDIVRKVTSYTDNIDKIKAMVQHTLGGSISKMKASLRSDVDRLFERHSEGIYDTVFRYIRNYDVRLDGFGSELEQMGFANAMYRVYQAFKQSVDMFMTDTVTPKIMRFVREKESAIAAELTGLAHSYEAMIRDAMVDFNRNLDQLGISPINDIHQGTEIPQIESVKSVAGISLPPAVAAFRYNAKIKTEAILRLGFYETLKIFKQVLKKPVRSELERKKNALKDGGQRMKRETEKSVRAYLKDYKENIKFQYLFRLADAYSEALKETITGRLQQYVDSLIQMIDDIRNRKLDRARATDVLEEMDREAGEIEGRIQRLVENSRAIER